MITQGLATIARARQIILIAVGEAKRDAVRRLLGEPPTVDRPASALAEHSGLTIVADRSAVAGVG